MALGQFGEAEERLLASHQRFSVVLGANHPFAREAAKDIARLYRAWGKSKKAARWEEYTSRPEPAWMPSE
jgi:hypothetical protein